MIDRSSPLGNPFPLDDPKDPAKRAAVLERYEAWFAERIEDPVFRRHVEAVRGRDLGCWCKTVREPDRACHGDTILAWLNANPA